MTGHSVVLQRFRWMRLVEIMASSAVNAGITPSSDVVLADVQLFTGFRLKTVPKLTTALIICQTHLCAQLKITVKGNK